MCCLFGVYNYGNKLKQWEINSVIASLGLSACERGTDATGISFLYKNSLIIDKVAKPAYDFDFKLPDTTSIVMGHTRFTTQGRENNNWNNHPFKGVCGKVSFALAHNGIIHNDRTLRGAYNLPSTKIETDSYIAVQLLEQNSILDAKAIGEMAEKLEGSYCFTILDMNKNLYLVKGDNPLVIVHNKELQAYAYASTETILLKGIIDSKLFANFKKTFINSPKLVEDIKLCNGDILKIMPNGTREAIQIAPNHPIMQPYCYRYESAYGSCDVMLKNEKEEYLSHLKDMAGYLGYNPDIVSSLADEGFAISEIEEFLYEGNEYCGVF